MIKEIHFNKRKNIYMVCKLLFAASVSILLSISCAKDEIADQKTFIRFYGIGNVSEGCDIIQKDNNFIIFGTCTNDSSTDLFLTKVNNYGNEIWKVNFGSSEDEVACSMKQLSDGGFLLLGTRKKINSPNQTEIYLVKTKPEGKSIDWDKVIKVDTASLIGNDAAVISSGGFLITGKATSNSGENYSFMIFTDENGNVIRQVFSNFYNLEIKKAIETNSGYLLAGTALPASTSEQDILILAVNKNGEIINHQTIKNLAEADQGKDLKKLSDGSFLVLGSEGTNKILLEKFTLKEEYYEPQWDKSYNNENYQPVCIELFADNQYVIAGNIQNKGIFLLKTDNSGTASAPIIIGIDGNQTCRKIIKTNDGKLAILGTNEYSGYKVIMLLKVEADGGL